MLYRGLNLSFENNMVWFWNSPYVQSTDSSVELYNVLSDSRFFFLTIFCTSFRKTVHNSKEIVNMRGLFVLTVGYVDMTTYPVTKYCYIIERVYFIIRYLYYLWEHCHSCCFYIWSYKKNYLHASIDILFYNMFCIINTMKKH